MFKRTLILIGFLSYLSIVQAQEPQAPTSETSDRQQTGTEQTNPGTVARAQFTSSIQEREPSDSLTTADTSVNRLYFFTELSGMQGHTVTHRWSFLGEKMAEINFNVGGNRWRVWSSKQMMPHWLGEWTAEIIASDGSVLSSRTLQYVAVQEAAPQTIDPVTQETISSTDTNEANTPTEKADNNKQ